jgi:hypothetical protein
VADEDHKPRRSRKAVVIGALIGAGAGFGLGVMAGIAAFDDAINSDRKVWTTAWAMAAGGAVAGGVTAHLVSRRTEPRVASRVWWRPGELPLPPPRRLTGPPAIGSARLPTGGVPDAAPADERWVRPGGTCGAPRQDTAAGSLPVSVLGFPSSSDSRPRPTVQ